MSSRCLRVSFRSSLLTLMTMHIMAIFTTHVPIVRAKSRLPKQTRRSASRTVQMCRFAWERCKLGFAPISSLACARISPDGVFDACRSLRAPPSRSSWPRLSVSTVPTQRSVTSLIGLIRVNERRRGVDFLRQI